jgi:hypothetical protein
MYGWTLAPSSQLKDEANRRRILLRRDRCPFASISPYGHVRGNTRHMPNVAKPRAVSNLHVFRRSRVPVVVAMPLHMVGSFRCRELQSSDEQSARIWVECAASASDPVIGATVNPSRAAATNLDSRTLLVRIRSKVYISQRGVDGDGASVH